MAHMRASAIHVRASDHKLIVRGPTSTRVPRFDSAKVSVLWDFASGNPRAESCGIVAVCHSRGVNFSHVTMAETMIAVRWMLWIQIEGVLSVCSAFTALILWIADISIYRHCVSSS
jgi:hypothetical protein